MQVFDKTWKEISPWTPVWFVATIIGNPFYNVVAFYLCDMLGYAWSPSTNVTQVNVVVFALILFGIFLIRYVVYRLIFVFKLKDQMTTPFFFEVFMERHKFQIISSATFFMWAGEVEGNIAGFLYFPVSAVLFLSIGVITFFRLFRMQKHLDKKK